MLLVLGLWSLSDLNADFVLASSHFFVLDRLVPALNVISDYYNIPNDIAGT